MSSSQAGSTQPWYWRLYYRWIGWRVIERRMDNFEPDCGDGCTRHRTCREPGR